MLEKRQKFDSEFGLSSKDRLGVQQFGSELFWSSKVRVRVWFGAQNIGFCTRAQFARITTFQCSRLVQLRNIWGAEHAWRGPWSEGSAEWQRHPEAIAGVPALAKLVGLLSGTYLMLRSSASLLGWILAGF